MRIDCSITENYLREKARMTINCTMNCFNCPLHSKNNNKNISCGMYGFQYPAEAISAVQKWSDEHPVMTNKEKFVQIIKDVFGINPVNACPPMSECTKPCAECKAWWDEPYREPEGKEK